VQGFMPTLARPEVDVLAGLTTAIIVDQERMGADARSTVGTATSTFPRSRRSGSLDREGRREDRETRVRRRMSQ
jgi:excinuclease UvrABC ATPase subunit